MKASGTSHHAKEKTMMVKYDLFLLLKVQTRLCAFQIMLFLQFDWYICAIIYAFHPILFPFLHSMHTY